MVGGGNGANAAYVARRCELTWQRGVNKAGWLASGIAVKRLENDCLSDSPSTIIIKIRKTSCRRDLVGANAAGYTYRLHTHRPSKDGSSFSGDSQQDCQIENLLPLYRKDNSGEKLHNLPQGRDAMKAICSRSVVWCVFSFIC